MTTETVTSAERREFGSLRLRGRVWWLRYRVDGKEHWESSRSESKRAAEKMLNRRQAELGLGVLVPPDTRRVGFADLVLWLEEDYRKRDNRSLPRVRRALTHLEDAFGHMRAVAITADRISRYTVARLDVGAARATINYELAVLRRAFRVAIELGRLTTAPTIKTPAPKNARAGFFNPADFAAVMVELPAYLQPVMAFAYVTGWRTRSEVLPLTWERVDFDAGIVRLDTNTTKNNAGRIFPFRIMPRLVDVLRHQREQTTAIEAATGRAIPLVFHRNGDPIRDYYAAWRSACKRASLGTPAGTPRPELLQRIPHDFRRTAVRNLVRAGVSEHTAMMLTGHRTRSVFDRYDIVDEKDLVDGVTMLAAHLDTPATGGTEGGQSPPQLTSGTVS